MKLHFLKTVWSDMIILEQDGKFALVDTGMADQYPELKAYLQKLGVKEIAFILLTHFHRDHYGCIPMLVQDYPVQAVYMKEYSGLDITTAWGFIADDAYRTAEVQKSAEICRIVQEHSELRHVEDTSEILLAGVSLKLFSTGNTIREIYEDASCPETYHSIVFGENQNSIGVFFRADGKSVFLGGDLLDLASPHPKANFVIRQIAEEIHESIDVYKAPHHGTPHTGCADTLSIFQPKLAIITNGDEYLREKSDVYANLRAANPDVRIVLTETKDVVIDLKDSL